MPRLNAPVHHNASTKMLATLLLAATAVGAAGAALDRAHVVVHKVLRSPQKYDVLVENRNFTVHYHVLNVGGGPAFDVTLTDEWPADSFTLLEGAPSGKWALLPRGANETVSVTYRPLVTGTLNSKSATVTYKYKDTGNGEGEEEDLDKKATGEEEEEDDLNEVATTSTSPGRVDIMTPSEYERAVADRTTHGLFVFLGAALLVGLAFTWWRSASAAVGAPAVAAKKTR